MKVILGSVATARIGVLLVTYGSLLTFRPDTFLWFHDTFIDRSRGGESHRGVAAACS